MIDATLEYIKTDYHSHRIRFAGEMIGMALSIGVSLILAITTPYPPMIICYIGWLIAAVLLAGASYSRGSVGLAVLYACFMVIDGIGFVRTLLVP